MFAALFGFFTVVFEISPAQILILQHRAESFPVAQGRILSGELVTVHGSKGSVSYRPLFLYEYRFAWQGYTSRRYRYDHRPSFSSFGEANQIVEAHPIGSGIPVYYNPANPDDAVLSPRVEGFDLGILFLGCPMCLWMLYNMIKIVREIRKEGKVAGGVKIISEMTVTRVRLPEVEPLAWGSFTFGVLSLIAGVAIAATVTHATLEIAGMTLLLVVLGGGGVYFWLWQKISSGTQDLVIDEAARTVQLPLTYKRREPVQYAFSEISGLQLQKIPHRGKSRVRYTYAPTLVIAGGKMQRLTDLSKKRAESFAGWLREKLGVTANASA